MKRGNVGYEAHSVNTGFSDEDVPCGNFTQKEMSQNEDFQAMRNNSPPLSSYIHTREKEDFRGLGLPNINRLNN
jgi:hypothetical protein